MAVGFTAITAGVFEQAMAAIAKKRINAESLFIVFIILFVSELNCQRD